MLKLHCLGTAGYHPNEHRHTSCYVVPEVGLVCDAGSGAFRLADLIQTSQLDVMISHAHLDHIVGLTFLLDVLYRAERTHGQKVDRLRIFGQQAKLDAIKDHLFADLVFPVQLEDQLDTQWIPIDDLDTFQAGGAEVTWREQPHPGGSVAYRFAWGDAALVYATDTSGFTNPADLSWMRGPAPGPSLLIHECYFRDENEKWALETGHSWTSRVADVVRATSPGKVILTHINPLADGDDPVDSARVAAAMKGELWVARDGLAVEFGEGPRDCRR